MTKQRSRKSSIFIWVGFLFEILFLIGAYAANYYTKTRMGMLRHVVYLNGKWEKAFPIDIIKYVVVALILTFIVFTVSKYFKYKNGITEKNFLFVTIGTVIISLWTVYFLIFYNAEINRAYYILGICFSIVSILQNVMWNFIFKLTKIK